MESFIQLRSYTISREASIVPSSQGYATFCNSRIDTTDGGQVVVQHEQIYVDSLVTTVISLIALALFASFAAPILIYQYYGKIYNYSNENQGNFIYLTWSIATLCIVADYLLTFLDLFYHILCWGRPHLDHDTKYLYVLAAGVWIGVAVIDAPIAIVVVLKSKIKDFPVPDLVRYILCNFHCCPCIKIEYFIQICAVGHTIFAVQIFSFHTVFIFIAFIAQPLHTCLTMIFYAAIVLCLTTGIMLLYASFHVNDHEFQKKRRRKEVYTNICFGILQAFVLIMFLFTITLFGFTFLRITVVAGDMESSRIASFIGSLLPSVLIAVLGFIAKKILDQQNENRRSDNVKISKSMDLNNSDIMKNTDNKQNPLQV